jgi:hypothetical protein
MVEVVRSREWEKERGEGGRERVASSIWKCASALWLPTKKRKDHRYLDVCG